LYAALDGTWRTVQGRKLSDLPSWHVRREDTARVDAGEDPVSLETEKAVLVPARRVPVDGHGCTLHLEARLENAEVAQDPAVVDVLF